jgi:hypothetical protein
MTTLIRRILVLVVLFFWQGGFVFYASVVIPIGTEVFDRHYRPDESAASGRRQQGRITRSVARWLNISGTVALFPVGWDAAACSDPRRLRKFGRAVLVIMTAILLGVLFGMYTQLDARFNRQTLALDDEALFLRQHRIYLWLASVQWGCCVAFLLLTVAAWRAEDLSAVDKTNEPTSRRGDVGSSEVEKSPADDLFGVAQSPKLPTAEH